MVSTSTRRTTTLALAGVGLVAALFGGAVAPAAAAITTNGPLDLGAAAGYAVLAATAVTNTGSSIVTGDLGIWPGTSITGFGGVPSPMVFGTVHTADTAANQAQSDTTRAYNLAASLTPTSTGMDQLTGRTLTPGIYAGGAVALAANSVLTLNGSATSVWVFQASSSLTIGSGAQVVITGGASACNVFWQVGTAATIGTGAQFQGTVLAQTSITAASNALIAGRLLAQTEAVTLDTDSITTPGGCAPRPPSITSGTPLAATVGTPYQHVVTATGAPVPTFTVSAGALPAGLVLNGTSGLISGVPTAAGSSTFSISAGNGATPDSTAGYTLVTAAAAVTPVLPVTPGVPGAPGIPVLPGDPALPGTPVVPGTPVIPGTPVLPGTPVVPGTPVIPGTPVLPGTPGAPGIPVLPGIPALPEDPMLPAPTAPAPTAPAPTAGPAATPSVAPAPAAGAHVLGAGTTLAQTGTDLTPTIMVGGLVLLAGTGLVAAAGFRRRQVRTGSR